MKLTARQAEILEFIALHRGEFGYSPTQREIAEAIGCAVARELQHLRKAGKLHWAPGVPRSIMLGPPGVPVIGTVGEGGRVEFTKGATS